MNEADSRARQGQAAEYARFVRSVNGRRRFPVLISGEPDQYLATLVHWDDAEPQRYAEYGACRLQHRAFTDTDLTRVLLRVVDYAGRKFHDHFMLEH